MGDAAGQDPDAFELLCLLNLRFEFLALARFADLLGDVRDHRENVLGFTALVEHRPQRYREIEVAIGQPDAFLEFPVLAAFEDFFQGGQDALSRGSGKQLHDFHAFDLAALETVRCGIVFHQGYDGLDGSGTVDHHDAVRRQCCEQGV